MKKIIFFTLSALFLWSTSAIAQGFDDVYFNPDDETFVDSDVTSLEEESVAVSDEYADDYVTDDVDNYDYQYSSRIRRFSNSYSGFNYYSDCYVDSYRYDPYSAGTSIYITNNRYNPYRYNPYRYNPYNSFGYNSYNPYGYNSFYSNRFNSGFGNPYGYGGFGGFGRNNNYFANSSPDIGNYNYTPRRGSSSNTSLNNTNRGARKKRGTVSGGNVRAGGEQIDAKGETGRVRNSRSGNVVEGESITGKRATRNSGSLASPRTNSESDARPSRSSRPSRNSSSRPKSSPSRSSKPSRSSRPSRNSSSRPTSKPSRSSSKPSRSSRPSRSSSRPKSSPSRSSSKPSRSSRPSRSSSPKSSNRSSSKPSRSSSSRKSSSSSKSKSSSSRRGRGN